jgi:PAS domain S-box-containing protein
MIGPADSSESSFILDAFLEASVSFVLICDARGEIEYANPAALRLFGKAQSAFERDSLFDMATNRRDRQRLLEAAANLKADGRRRLEMVLHSVEGLHVPTSMTLRMIDGAEGGEGRLLIIGDAAAAIPAVAYVSSLASNNLVIRMLNGSVDPVFLIDPGTRIVRDCNLAATALFGWSREELIGSSLRKLYPSEEAFKAIGERWPRLESRSGVHEEELLLMGIDGRAISCKLTTLCIYGPKGDAELRVAILRDITKAHIREDTLIRLAARTTELAVELTQLTKHQIPIGKESLTNLGLTERQAQLARYAAIGMTSKEMAFKLGLSESTVKNHFSAMFRKFGISSRTELIALLSDRHIPLK